jgi:hypothetical protein
VKTPSTVAGVEALLDDEQNGSSSAAIASSVCERLFDGVQVLQKGIQDETCESPLLLARSYPFFFFSLYSYSRRACLTPFFSSKFHEILRPRPCD